MIIKFLTCYVLLDLIAPSEVASMPEGTKL